MSTTSYRHLVSTAPSLLRCCTFKMPLSFMKGLLHLSIENFVCIAVVYLFVCMCLFMKLMWPLEKQVFAKFSSENKYI